MSEVSVDNLRVLQGEARFCERMIANLKREASDPMMFKEV